MINKTMKKIYNEDQLRKLLSEEVNNEDIDTLRKTSSTYYRWLIGNNKLDESINYETYCKLLEDEIEIYEDDHNVIYYVECSIVKDGIWLKDTDHWEFKNYRGAKYLYDSLNPYNSTITLTRIYDEEDEIIELKEKYEK